MPAHVWRLYLGGHRRSDGGRPAGCDYGRRFERLNGPPGATGLLVAAGSATTLATALAQLVDDADLRQEMGEGARERAAESLDAQENARRLVAIMEAVS